jgi:hypothetical protein
MDINLKSTAALVSDFMLPGQKTFTTFILQKMDVLSTTGVILCIQLRIKCTIIETT